MGEAAIASAVNAIIIIDDQGRIQRANPAAERLFGYAVADMLDQKVDMLMPEPYRSAHDGYLTNYLRSGVKKIIGIGREVTGCRKDGTIFPMHLSVGEFEAFDRCYFVGSIHDISARRAAQAESLRQKTFFQSIFDNCPDAMIISELDGTITLCNPAATRIFGYAAEDLIGRPLRAIYANDADYAQIANREPLPIPSRQIEARIITFARGGGAHFPGVAAFTRIVDTGGGGFGFLTVVRDVSYEVAQEQALRKIQRMEALGQLTGGIAHDFNNLLTIITGNHELLEMEIEDTYQLDLLKRANDAAMMGARLTDRLLTFARRRPLDAVLVNLNELVLGTMDLLRRTLGEIVILTSALSPDLWPVRSDVSEIENAVLNLAINARDAMPGGGKLMLETKNVLIDDGDLAKEVGLAPGGYVRLSVSDTGEGMPPEVLSRVFEPFFTTKEAGKGTGLGLSVIYGFAKQSGGEVTIYSEVARGTTVNLYLPRALSETAGAFRADMPAASAQRAAGETILIVEDQPLVREVTMRRLAQLGYEVLQADSAVSAIELLEGGASPDLVFSDVVMPGGKTGFDLAAWVRAKRPSLPVVLTSGFAEDVVHTATQGEHLEMLRKPYGRDDLAATIRAALDRVRK
jgi:PAS domain S-box-containing protein